MGKTWTRRPTCAPRTSGTPVLPPTVLRKRPDLACISLLREVFESRGHAHLDLGGISSTAHSPYLWHWPECNPGRKGEEKLITGSGLGLAAKDDKIIEAERGISGMGTCRNQGGGL